MATKYLDSTGLTYLWGKIKSRFQEKLISGTNIKTINNESILGSGDISVSDGGYPYGETYENGGVYVNITTAGAENYVKGASVTVPYGRYIVIASGTFPSTSANRAFRVRITKDDTEAKMQSITSSYWCTLETVQIVDVTNNTAELACWVSCSITANGCNTFIKAIRIQGYLGSQPSVLDYYPVGSYYETSDTSFDPNVSWGGAWDLEEDGMMLLSSSETHTVGDTGGEETVSLAIANMPAHSHKSGANGEYIVTTADAEANNTRVAYSSSGNRYVDGLTSQSHFHHRVNTNSVGSGTAHNNMPPYKVVNRWHRTA